MRLLLIFVLLVFGCNKKVAQVHVFEKVYRNETKHDTVEVERIVTVKESEPVNVTVYFPFGSSDLTLEAKRILNGVKGRIKSPVRLTGGACLIGNDAANYRLGLRRASRVHRYLNLSDGHEIYSTGEGDCVGNLNFCRKVVICGQN